MGGKLGTGVGAVDNTPAPTPVGTHHPCPCAGVPQISLISLAGPEIPLSSYPPPAPPAPFPVDPKAGPMPPQPGFTPMAMYPSPGPAAQYPMYPSGPPVYNPAGEHWGGKRGPSLFPRGPRCLVTPHLLPPQHHHPTSRHSPAIPEHDPPRGPPHLPPASGASLGTPGTRPGAGGLPQPALDQAIPGHPGVMRCQQNRAALVPHTGPFVGAYSPGSGCQRPRAPAGGSPGGVPRGPCTAVSFHSHTWIHLLLFPPGLALNHVWCPQPCVVSVTLSWGKGEGNAPNPFHEL